ncbi:TPA: hypothetical protein ACJHGQ_003218, partial [Yersinia enterocolitica]
LTHIVKILCHKRDIALATVYSYWLIRFDRLFIFPFVTADYLDLKPRRIFLITSKYMNTLSNLLMLIATPTTWSTKNNFL